MCLCVHGWREIECSGSERGNKFYVSQSKRRAILGDGCVECIAKASSKMTIKYVKTLYDGEIKKGKAVSISLFKCFFTHWKFAFLIFMDKKFRSKLKETEGDFNNMG